MAYSGLGRALWTPTLQQQETAAAFSSLSKPPEPDVQPAEKAGVEAVAPAGPAEYDSGSAGGAGASTSRVAAGPIAAAALGPIAAAAAAAATISGGAPNDIVQSMLREVTAHDEDAAAASEAFQEDNALLLQPEQPAVRAPSPAAGLPSHLYGTDEFRGYKTVGVVDTDDRGAPLPRRPAADAAARVPEPLAPAGWLGAAPSGAVQGYGVPGDEVASGGVEGSEYCWRGPLEEPLIQPTPEAAPPGRAGAVYSPSSRRVTFADQLGAAPMARRALYSNGRRGWELGAPAAARLTVLFFTAAAISGWWTFKCLRSRERAIWAVLWGLITAATASLGTFLGVLAATAGNQIPSNSLASVNAAGTGAGGDSATAGSYDGGSTGTAGGNRSGNGGGPPSGFLSQV